MTTVEYKDFLGNHLKVGDFVAYGVSRRHSAHMNFGIIIGLSTRDGNHWDDEIGKYVPNKFPTVKVALYESREEREGVKPYRKTGLTHMSIRRATTENGLVRISDVDVPKRIAEFLRSGKKEDTYSDTKTPSIADITDDV